MYEYLILIMTILVLVLCSHEAFAARQGPSKAKWEFIEGDHERTHEETITSGSHEYGVKMSGEVGGYKAAFWDKEYLTFALIQAPEWLKIDLETGELSGTPGADAMGKHDIVLRVTNSKGGEAERKFVVQVTDRGL